MPSQSSSFLIISNGDGTTSFLRNDLYDIFSCTFPNLILSIKLSAASLLSYCIVLFIVACLEKLVVWGMSNFNLCGVTWICRILLWENGPVIRGFVYIVSYGLRYFLLKLVRFVRLFYPCCRSLWDDYELLFRIFIRFFIDPTVIPLLEVPKYSESLIPFN